MKKIIGMAIIAAAFMLLGSASAQAQCGGFGALGYGGIGGYGLLGLNGNAYRSGRVPTPPYFALHPPVYYSQAVSRTYGHSPFAYPGTKETPAAAPAPKAAMIENPHVKPAAAAKEESKPKLNLKQITQLEVVNPFFKSNATKLVSVEQ